MNTITPVDTVTSVDTLTPVDSLIPTKNLILIYQSDNILKKRLNTILPLYIYYLQMIHIHNYKYKN